MRCVDSIITNNTVSRCFRSFSCSTWQFSTNRIFRSTTIDDSGAIVPVAAGKQSRCIANQIADPHARLPGVTARVCHMAAQSYRVFKAGNDGEYANDVAIFDGKSARLRVEGELQCLTSVIGESVNRNLTAVGNIAQVTRHFDQVIQRGILFQFVDGRQIHRSRYRSLRTNVRNKQHVAGLKTHILRFVALQQKVIEIKVCDGSAIPSNLNMSQRSLRSRSTRSENRIDQSAE